MSFIGRSDSLPRFQNNYPSRMDVKIFRDDLGKQAHEAILRLLDTDHNGTLSAVEKLKARIVLYGHSWGASEAVHGPHTGEGWRAGVVDHPGG